MNATSLYVSTCRLILQANADDSSSWMDLYRLVPYLRQSLSCTVCGNLLIEPYTPTETNCQHHVCKSCKGGKKKLKPSCSWCKDYNKYIENVQLRILLQCYKKLCEYITSTSIFKKIVNTSAPTSNVNTNLLDGTSPTLTHLIQEGSGFADEFRCSTSIRPSNYVLPCIFTNTTSTQTNSASTSVFSSDDISTLPSSNGERENTGSPKQVHNGSSIYSVLYAGTGNKLTIKRKASDPYLDNLENNSQQIEFANVTQVSTANKGPANQSAVNSSPSKKSTRGKSASAGAVVKSGCRCGNATAFPGKLTCCGQRCACYTDSKPCIDCKCRGCRNPHTADGQKMCPLYQLQVTDDDGQPSKSLSLNSGGTVQVVGVYTTQLQKTSSPILLDANTTVTTCGSEDFDSDAGDTV